MTDLIRRSVEGDADAFLELIEQNSLTMYKTARSILHNDEDAADAIQDTILICFEKIHTLKKPEYFKTWMIRILINECTKILRHYRNLNIRADMPEAYTQDMSLAEFEFKEMLELVEERYRVILILYYVEGYKLADIAEILNTNENTVKTRLSRARQQIREIYCGGKPKVTPIMATEKKRSMLL